MDLTNLTITQAHKGLMKKEFSTIELTKAFLNKISNLDKKVFAFLTVTRELALSQAKIIDDLIMQGKDLPVLCGIPSAIKDIIQVSGIRCTAGSKILQNYISPYDATVIKKLKNQGIVILGKTNMDEFAMGSSCENSAFGPTRNPNDLERVPGGSSGGSAAAVASDECIYALGSDTGGSIRLPASFCGVVGLKPTYGAVSRYGLIAMASSLDQIGPITKTVEDAKIVFDAIKGKDIMDSTSVNSKLKTQSSRPTSPASELAGGRAKPQLKAQNLKNLRIGIPKEYFVKGMDAEVEQIVKKAIKKFEGLGAKIEEITLPHTEYALAVYYIIMPAEASANLARYDGIKYGYSKVQGSGGQKPKIENLLDVYLKTRQEGFGEEVRRRIMLGTYTLSAGYYEAYYLKAQKVRTLIKQDFEKAFQKVDVILTPTSPTPPFKLGEKIIDPLSMYLSDIFTVSVNLAGLPAVSFPCGKIKNLSPRQKFGKGDLPVGIQLIGKPFEENKILEVAQLFEENYGF